MPVEIEKPTVSFTDEAQRVLQQSLLRLERRIRAKAADHAIKSRGTPSEVTGSDIEKAYRELIDPGPRELVSDRIQKDQKQWRKSAALRLISRLYVWIGLFVAACGVIYPFVRSQLLNPSSKLSVTFALVGLSVALLGFSLSSYLTYRDAIQSEEALKRYSRVYDVFRKGID